MTTEQTAEQLELAAQILRTGHPWEYKTAHLFQSGTPTPGNLAINLSLKMGKP